MYNKDKAKKQLIKSLLNLAGCMTCSALAVILYKSGQSSDLILSLLMGGFVVCMVQGTFATGTVIYYIIKHLRKKLLEKSKVSIGKLL